MNESAVAGTPIVSVIVPAKDAAQWIPEQLRALASQVHAPSFEVVIGDNGSTDGTREAALQEPVPFTVRVVDASGPASASHGRNVAVRAARGRILLFCDADDLVGRAWVRSLTDAVVDDPSRIATGALHHGRFNSPEVLAAYRIGPDPKVDELARPTTVKENPGGFAGHLQTVAGGNFAIHRSAYLALGGMDASYPGGAEETDFAWRAQQAGMRVVSVPQAVVHYRLKSEPRSLFRQQRIQQRGRIYLWTRYRDSPMQGPSLKGSALEVVRGAAAFPASRRDEGAQLAWSARVGAHVGALEGMVRYRWAPSGRRARLLRRGRGRGTT
ncbi:glycosyltransferase family 2 protein [Microbacterium sp. NPDC006705]|uniref:glycosyltransferase family 2 protein n=1 Tax=Micrococcales TaxID=85006 RepID=UPI0037A82262